MGQGVFSLARVLHALLVLVFVQIPASAAVGAEEARRSRALLAGVAALVEHGLLDHLVRLEEQ